jgi:hypothetical protein
MHACVKKFLPPGLTSNPILRTSGWPQCIGIRYSFDSDFEDYEIFTTIGEDNGTGEIRYTDGFR